MTKYKVTGEHKIGTAWDTPEKFTPEIGECKKLAPGHENPMWAIEKNIEKVAKIGVKALKLTEPKHTKKIVVSSKGFDVKVIEMPEDTA